MEEKGVENLCFPQQIYTFVCKTQNAYPDRSLGTVACGTIPAGGCRGGRRRTPATGAPEAENNEEQL